MPFMLPMLRTLNCPGEKVWRARSLTDLEPGFAVRSRHCEDGVYRDRIPIGVAEESAMTNAAVRVGAGLRSWQPGRAHGYEELAAAIAFEDKFAARPAGARE